ncbi:Putative METTL16/RlmF family, S-adenosyl-L-methionine-dependent methyltransferase [Septoria linicola]|uniref:METTL16/RlmF family, S-adenosyl-L-methionine-dependent methyltransferase n=1 Tax=Septoria linicola TaxID=215465 RepID=A0A9Q9ASR9_9PEZI|nr:Putative METTL16/RlmF family, S-adenosyl-L-methionine-dependent methyltransferase [Septoria linicola]
MFESEALSEPPRKKVKTDYYSRDVDFNALAKDDADFAAISKAAKQDGWIDFHDPKVVQQLTKSLLRYDFGLSLNLPDDRLCPPIPVRWNYIRWIQDLLDTTSPTPSDIYDPEREVLGLDIGVGASCIYSLLACASRPEWQMAGTDIDSHSLSYAKQNVASNNLEDRIRLKQMKPEQALIPIDAMGVEELDFVMTNPPFYSSEKDFLASYNDSERKAKTTESDSPPSAVCVGASNEMICEAGDVGFVTRIIEQSLQLRDRVQWYTAMLSHMHSLQQIVARLKEQHITNFAVTSLHPGNKTKRYAVAWSFGHVRPRNDVARHGELVLDVLPMATAKTIRVPFHDTRAAGKKVDGIMKGLEGVEWGWRPLLDAGVMQCKENVWSRAARRQKMFADRAKAALGGSKNGGEEEESDSNADDGIVLAVKITCKGEEVEVRWLRGNDFVIFESFCGMLQRALNKK